MSVKAITPYIPFRILEKLVSDEKKKFQRAEKLNGSVLFVDMAKFTRLTTAIENSIESEQQGRGAEILQAMLTEYFTVLIETIRKYGGIVYQFAGDSVLVGMEKEDGESDAESVLRASACAIEIQKQLQNLAKRKIANEEFELAAKVSIGFGDYYQILLGSPRYFMNSTILGKPIEDAIIGESMAEANQIFISAEAWNLLSGAKEGVAKGNYFIIKSVPAYEYKSKRMYAINDDDFEKNHLKLCSKFIAPVLYKKISSGHTGFLGDFREVTSLFLRFDGLKYTEEAAHSVSLLNTFYEHVQNLSDDYGGALIQVDLTDKGNVFLVLFGAPQALENKEIMACRMADKLFSSLVDFGFAKNVQVGIATGPLYCGDLGASFRKGYTVVGETANYASRLMNFSGEQATFIDKHTANKVADSFELTEVKDAKLKGVQDAQTVFRLGHEIVKTREQKSFVYTEELVGRLDEMQRMKDALDFSMKSQGQTLIMTGEAGVGKSRLTAAFLEDAKEYNLIVYATACYSYEKNTPLYPWKDVLWSIFKLDTNPDTVNVVNAIKSYLATLEDVNEDWANVIARLLGYPVEETAFTANIEPRLKNDRVFQIILEILKKESLNKSIVIFFEDMHWSDELSRNLCAFLIDHIVDDSILILLVGRPADDTKSLIDNPNTRWIDLAELGDADARQLLKLRLSLDKENHRIEELVLSRCRGNPFFIESIVHSFREQGILEPAGEANFRLAKEVNEIQVPNTLQDVILSRIDRLTEHEQAVLKTASVIGRIFLHDIVARLAPASAAANLNHHFQSLIDLELTPVESTSPLSYIFKHIVIRDVAYNSLLTSTRKGLHLQLAEILEDESDGENIHDTADILAYHYLEGDNYDKGYEYSLMAARKAREQYANNDAISYYLKAIDALKRTDRNNKEELLYEIKEELAITSRQGGKYDDAKQLYSECLKYYKKSIKKGQLHIGLGQLYQEQGDPIHAIKEMETALKFLGKRPPGNILATVSALLYQTGIQLIHVFLPFMVVKTYKNPERYRLRSQALMVLQKIYIFVSVERVAWSGLAHVNLAERMKTDYDLSLAYSNYGAILMGIGLKGVARKYFELGHELSISAGDPYAEGTALQLYGFYGTFVNDMDHTLKYCGRSINMFKQMGEHWQAGTSLMIMTFGYDGKGDHRKSLEQMEEMYEIADSVNSKMHISWAMGRIAYYKFMLDKMNTESALENVRQSKDIAKEVMDSPGFLTALRYEALILAYSGRYEEAYDVAKTTIQEIIQFKVKFPHIIMGLVDMAEILTEGLAAGFYQKSKRKAEKLVKKAFNRAISEGKMMPVLSAPGMRAKTNFIAYKQGAHKARPLFEKTLAAIRKHPNRYELAKTLRDKGLLYEDAALIDEAKNLFEENYPREAERLKRRMEASAAENAS